MNKFVRVLSDDEGLGFCVSHQLDQAGYAAHATSTVADFTASLHENEDYVFITDYLLGREGCSEPLLSALLTSGAAPKAVIVMSALPRFEDALEAVSARYTGVNIPFFFIQKPFHQEKLVDILFMIERNQGPLRECATVRAQVAGSEFLPLKITRDQAAG